MVWFRKNSLIHRFVPLLLLAVMLVGQITLFMPQQRQRQKRVSVRHCTQ